MNKLSILFQLGAKFSSKYFAEYFQLMLKPIVVAIIGILSIVMVEKFPSILTAILSLVISLPCIFYSFWRGFMITYALNILALDFIKNSSSKNLEQCYKIIKNDEKDFALYVGFIAIVTIICYIPTFYFFFEQIPLATLLSIAANPSILADNIYKIISVTIFSTVNTLIICPFLNFATQAYLFKQDESHMQLLSNCFKYLNKTGLILATGITLFTLILTGCLPVIYILAFLIINIFVYSINTFWYYSRVYENNQSKK